MNKKPLVSVVIPVYNVEKYLDACVNSVLTQSYQNIEIILVNDGSPDRSPELCDKLAENNSNIKVVHKKNGGLSDARNYGISNTTGDYILFLDSDDTLEKDAISELIKKAIATMADIVMPDRYVQVDEETGKRTLKYHFDKSSHIQDPKTFAIEVVIGRGRAWRAHALLYKTSLIKKYDFKFPVGYIAEDIVFNLQLLAKANKIEFYNKSTLNYLKRSGSITTIFQEDLDDTFLFIDEKVKEFLVSSDFNDLYGNKKRDELLCRGVIIYISDLFSKKCFLEKEELIKKANNLITNKRVIEAFKTSEINPYFGSKYIMIYFKIMFFLIKNGYKNFAFKLAYMAGKI